LQNVTINSAQCLHAGGLGRHKISRKLTDGLGRRKVTQN
jgi:hypothetical protein